MCGMLEQHVLQVLGPQGGANAGAKLEGVERLGHVVDRAEVQARDFVVGGRGAGEEEDGDHAQFPVGLQTPADVEARDVGHVEVEQDQVGLLASGGLQAENAAFAQTMSSPSLARRALATSNASGSSSIIKTFIDGVLPANAFGAYPF